MEVQQDSQWFQGSRTSHVPHQMERSAVSLSTEEPSNITEVTELEPIGG